MVQIQYTSDLHINEWQKGTPFESFITPIAPILVLAGDVCSVWDPLYSHFLTWVSHNWHIVIFVAGNHEYQNTLYKTMYETECEIRRICKTLQNVVFLQYGESYCIGNLCFIGATLWSNIDPSIHAYVREKKGDFKHTYIEDGNIVRNTEPADHCAWHTFDVQRLLCSIDKHKDKQIIVVSHYMPSKELLEDEYKNEILHTCYASDCDFLLTHRIQAWICGHSHRAMTWKSPNGVCVYMNARGYNREKEIQRLQDKYSNTAHFRIDKK